MDTLHIERRLIHQINNEHDPKKRAELKEELNTLLLIDIQKHRDDEKIEELRTKLSIAENL